MPKQEMPRIMLAISVIVRNQVHSSVSPPHSSEWWSQIPSRTAASAAYSRIPSPLTHSMHKMAQPVRKSLGPWQTSRILFSPFLGDRKHIKRVPGQITYCCWDGADESVRPGCIPYAGKNPRHCQETGKAVPPNIFHFIFLDQGTPSHRPANRSG